MCHSDLPRLPQVFPFFFFFFQFYQHDTLTASKNFLFIFPHIYFCMLVNRNTICTADQARTSRILSSIANASTTFAQSCYSEVIHSLKWLLKTSLHCNSIYWYQGKPQPYSFFPLCMFWTRSRWRLFLASITVWGLHRANGSAEVWIGWNGLSQPITVWQEDCNFIQFIVNRSCCHFPEQNSRLVLGINLSC